MSTPVTPTATRKRAFSQGPNSGSSSSVGGGGDASESGSGTGSGGWLGALGGVFGEWLQGWGLLGVLRKKSGVPGGARSTPATPPTHSHPSTPSHEHIELRQLNFQCSEGVDGGGDGGGGGDGIGGGGSGPSEGCSPSVLSGEVLRRRLRPPHSLHHPRRAPRHSYYEGSSPDSYLLTAVLIHSLKHGSGRVCQEPHCQLCSNRLGRDFTRKDVDRGDTVSEKAYNTYASEDLGSNGKEDNELTSMISEQSLNRSVSEDHDSEKKVDLYQGNPDIQVDLDYGQVSPMSSPTGSFQFAQISPLPSPHSSSITMSSTLSSITPVLSLTSCGSSEVPLLESEVSSFDISSLTDVTMSSSFMSGSALSLHQGEDSLLIADTTTGSELSLTAASTDCGTLVGSYNSDTLQSYSSDTIPSDSYPEPMDSYPIPDKSCPPYSPEPRTLDSYQRYQTRRDDMSSSVQSLPSRFSLRERSSSTVRPVLLSSGSLVLLPRRPSLASPPSVSSVSSQGHFLWEEVGLLVTPCPALLSPLASSSPLAALPNPFSRGHP
ncbi:hypothetical protein Pmani_030587 [Petrolisthes manimaculis]|uniref:Uncharacterized protein n=1 Tax=Petrolisthes manimaculis TaxID=1843537 RepID=A0AAE1TVS1_9EUCA|nr:hypothetical protein Pmani_030587 [Petrolisthes manimaculis]